MMKRLAWDGVQVDFAMSNPKIVDNEFVSTRQNRWTDLLLTAAEAINSRDSPFLHLPAELRIKIYGYVLGYKHIYPDLRQFSRRRTSHLPGVVCDCDGARDERAHSRTHACFSAPLHLGLLSTCRQTYLEASPILWSTNIFCFEDSRIMSLTFQSLASRQASLIQNLRIDVNHFDGGPGGLELNTNLKPWNLTSLPGLRKLQLFFNTYERPHVPTTTTVCRRVPLVNSVRELSAPRPSSAVVPLRHDYVYNTFDVKLLAQSFRTKESLKRLEEMLVDKASGGIK